MAFPNILLFLYLLVAGLSMVMTRREQHQKGIDHPVPRLLGFLACAAWPVVFAVVLVIALRTPDSPRPGPVLAPGSARLSGSARAKTEAHA